MPNLYGSMGDPNSSLVSQSQQREAAERKGGSKPSPQNKVPADNSITPANAQFKAPLLSSYHIPDPVHTHSTTPQKSPKPPKIIPIPSSAHLTNNSSSILTPNDEPLPSNPPDYPYDISTFRSDSRVDLIDRRGSTARRRANKYRKRDICAQIFYGFIASLSIAIILCDLMADITLAIMVYYETAYNTYFYVCVAAFSASILAYTINSGLFFCYSGFCECAGPFAPLFRCIVSLPPFGIVYTLLLMPGVHSLPFHMLAALVQYGANLLFMMTNTSAVQI